MSDPKDKTTKEGALPPDDPREPYPTGNPPEPSTFEDFHPQEARALELEKEAAKPAAKAEPEEEDDDPKYKVREGEEVMALADLNRSNDTPITTLKLSDIAVKNWHRFPTPISKAMTDDIYIPTQTWNGGVVGDETVAETNVRVDDQSIGDYGPRNLTEKMAWPGAPNSVVPSEPTTGGQVVTAIADYTQSADITAPRGYLGPSDPYSKPAPAAPTITSLTPNTGVSGAGKPPIWTTIAGTGFTQWSTVETGGVLTPYFRFISATRIDMAQDPRSTPGTVGVVVIDHGVRTAATNFTFS